MLDKPALARKLAKDGIFNGLLKSVSSGIGSGNSGQLQGIRIAINRQNLKKPRSLSDHYPKLAMRAILLSWFFPSGTVIARIVCIIGADRRMFPGLRNDSSLPDAGL